MNTPRGIRNCNPLNIRRSTNHWQGMRQEQTDPQFCQFETMEWGWRAAFRLLTRTYYTQYHLGTIAAIVRKWAPATENNTQAYIASVARHTGIGPDEPLGSPAAEPARWMMLAMAMALHECGTNTLDALPMLRGWALNQP